MAKKNVPTDAEIMKYRNVPVLVAAAYLGCAHQTLRESLRQGRAPFGYAVKGEESGKWTFHISPGLLVSYQNGTLRSMAESDFIREIASEIERVLELRALAAMEILAPGLAKKRNEAQQKAQHTG